MHILIFVWILGSIIAIGSILFFSGRPLKKLISELGGKMNSKGEGVLSLQGRDVFIKYIPGSRNRSPELRIYTKGNFGAELLIRYENSIDRFYKKIGLNRELQISDREANDQLYFECDDQEFLNFLFLNPQTKSDVFEILKSYSAVQITKGMCLLRKYPASSLSDISKEDIARSAQELLDLSSLIPNSSGNHPELGFFKVKSALLYFLGSVVFIGGVISWVWALCQYRVVDAMRLWVTSFSYSVPMILAAGFLAFFAVKGFSTSSKVFIYFLFTFTIGAILCGRYGATIINGYYDRSPTRDFVQVVTVKYMTTHKGNTYYHVLVKPWHSGMNSWQFAVTRGVYASIHPGSTRFQISTRSGRLGFEWIIFERMIPWAPGNSSRGHPLSGYINGMDLGKNTQDIPINSLMSLNGMNRDSILNMRQQCVQQIPSLVPLNYQPNTAVFGQIQDGRPWWGLLGLSYFGPGEKSIEGPSRESQFICNPYVLIGVENPSAHIIKDASLTPEIIHPVLKQLKWEMSGAWGQVTYNMRDYYNRAVSYGYPDLQDVYLKDYNARDFGFNYFAIDSASSQNISGATDKVLSIIQFIHIGRSCGYPGGCNNMSPEQLELYVKWNDLPARIYLKLWKKKVDDVSQKSDMDFIIDLI